MNAKKKKVLPARKKASKKSDKAIKSPRDLVKKAFKGKPKKKENKVKKTSMKSPDRPKRVEPQIYENFERHGNGVRLRELGK